MARTVSGWPGASTKPPIDGISDVARSVSTVLRPSYGEDNDAHLGCKEIRFVEALRLGAAAVRRSLMEVRVHAFVLNLAD